MDKLEIKGNWNILKGKIKEKYGEVIDDEIPKLEGNEDKLLGMLQKKTGKQRQELIEEINNL